MSQELSSREHSALTALAVQENAKWVTKPQSWCHLSLLTVALLCFHLHSSSFNSREVHREAKRDDFHKHFPPHRIKAEYRMNRHCVHNFAHVYSASVWSQPIWKVQKFPLPRSPLSPLFGGWRRELLAFQLVPHGLACGKQWNERRSDTERDSRQPYMMFFWHWSRQNAGSESLRRRLCVYTSSSCAFLRMM